VLTDKIGLERRRRLQRRDLSFLGNLQRSAARTPALVDAGAAERPRALALVGEDDLRPAGEGPELTA